MALVTVIVLLGTWRHRPPGAHARLVEGVRQALALAGTPGTRRCWPPVASPDLEERVRRLERFAHEHDRGREVKR